VILVDGHPRQRRLRAAAFQGAKRGLRLGQYSVHNSSTVWPTRWGRQFRYLNERARRFVQ
jgi:hypothetical protein